MEMSMLLEYYRGKLKFPGRKIRDHIRGVAQNAVLFKINIDIYKPNIKIPKCPLSTLTVSEPRR